MFLMMRCCDMREPVECVLDCQVLPAGFDLLR